MSDAAAGAGRGRAAHLDLLKTLLVAGMISAHVVQLIAADPPRGAWLWSDYVNLVTFSGFLLAFGIGLGMSRRVPPWRARLEPVAKIWLAVVASSLGFALLVDGRPLSGTLVWDVATTRVLFGWSEFLTAFLVLYLALALGRRWVLRVAGRPDWLLALAVAGLGSTFLATDRLWPLVGGVIGHTAYANFPVLGYAPWFLAGLHLGARGRRIGGGDLAIGAAATGVFALVSWQEGGWPQRFPPSVPWIIGAGLPLVLSLWITERVAARVPGALLAAGRHVLASLVLSNLVIFGIRWGWGWPVQGAGAILGTSLALIAGVTLWGVALDRIGRRRAAT